MNDTLKYEGKKSCENFNWQLWTTYMKLEHFMNNKSIIIDDKAHVIHELWLNVVRKYQTH